MGWGTQPNPVRILHFSSLVSVPFRFDCLKDISEVLFKFEPVTQLHSLSTVLNHAYAIIEVILFPLNFPLLYSS